MKPRNVAAIRAILVCLAVGRFAGAAFAEATPPKAPSSARIAGRILDPSGKPVAGVIVRLRLLDTDPREWKEQRAAVRTGSAGGFEFEKLPDGWFVITAEAAGFAEAFRTTQLEAGQQLAVDLSLGKPAVATIVVRDEAGRPVAKARVRTLSQRGANGKFAISAIEQEAFGIAFGTRDESGRLRLPPLPVGSTINVILDHDHFAPITLEDAVVKPDVFLKVALHRGVGLTLEFKPEALGRQISEIEFDLRHQPFKHPSTIVNHRIPVQNGRAKVMVDAGNYRLLWLKHRDYLVTPWYQPNIVEESFLKIEPGTNNVLTFQVLPKVTVKGRALDQATGKPIAGASIHGEIQIRAPREAGKTFSGDWMHADWATTDKEGRYTLRLAAGAARVSLQESNFYTKETYFNCDVAKDGSTVVPEIAALRMPKVRGQVIGPDGRPAGHTVVRFRGKLEPIQPTVTDSQGRFELEIPWIPVEKGKRVLAHPLVAFHAYEPLGARAEIRLDRPETLSNVTLLLGPEPYERQLAEVDGDMSPWERGDLSSPERRKLAHPELRGQPAPELACPVWLNTPRAQNRLADFRGRYVLLDFWTVWCGPCHADFPSVKLAQELYHDHGFAVIGVHDNSVPPDAIRKHMASQKIDFPVAIDAPDGRTLRAYGPPGVVGYPTYLLLGPAGTILRSDNRLPGPGLRSFKLEIIRACLFGDQSAAKRPQRTVSQREHR